MCMITFLPGGIPVDVTAVFNGTIYNDDGHGFAMIDRGGELLVRRGLDAVSMVELFAELRSQNPDGPAMFHSRMATHGVTDKSNVHPFYVGGDRRTVLVHNGIFSQLSSEKHPWSDTKIFAQSLLPNNPRMNLLTRSGRINTQKWMGSYNKVAVITTNPRSKLSSFILNEKEGYWDGGAWYSGLDYLGGSRYFKGGYYSSGPIMGMYRAEEYDVDDWLDHRATRGSRSVAGKDLTDDDKWEAYWEDYVAEHGICRFCDSVGSIDKTGVCAACAMCNDCSQPEQFCTCV